MAQVLNEYDVYIHRQVYYNAENGYAVYRFATKERLFDWQEETTQFNQDWFLDTVEEIYIGTMVGNLGNLDIGMKYHIAATEDYIAKYKQTQLKVQSCVVCKPLSAAEQYVYLRNILSSNQVKVLTDVYPNIVSLILEDEGFIPDYTKLKGIKEATYAKIKKKVIDNYILSDLLVMLEPFNINNGTVERLIKAAGSTLKLKEELTNNPYTLTEYQGFGFISVDKIVLAMKPELISSRFRLISFVKYYLSKRANDDGCTWITEEEFKNAVRANIPETKQEYKLLKQECIDGTANGDSNVLLHISDGRVGLKKVYDMEYELITRLHELQDYSTAEQFSPEDCRAAVELTNKQNGYELTDKQISAIYGLRTNNVELIVGNAGTGKSSSIKGVTNLYANKEIAMCALSAKAAQRMREVTGLEAKTIHRLLKWKDEKFAYNNDNKLPYDIIIVDEASMINASLFLHLVRAIAKGTKLVIVFDNAQLPPIGMGNIAADLLNDSFLPLYKLDKIHRQAQQSGILTDGNTIRTGVFPIDSFDNVTTGELQDMHYIFIEEGDNQLTYQQIQDTVIRLFKEKLRSNDIDDITVISPFRKNGINSTNTLNALLQEIVLPNAEEIELYGRKFKVGAKVIQKKNNSEKDVVNGEIGYLDTIIKSKDKPTGVVIQYDGGKYVSYNLKETEQFDLAYALTVHSFQGSECKNIIICLDNSMMIMLDNCLLYTAITRAKKDCCIVAQPKAFVRCVETNKSISRNTYASLIIQKLNYKNG